MRWWERGLGNLGGDQPQAPLLANSPQIVIVMWAPTGNFPAPPPSEESNRNQCESAECKYVNLTELDLD